MTDEKKGVTTDSRDFAAEIEAMRVATTALRGITDKNAQRAALFWVTDSLGYKAAAQLILRSAPEVTP